MKGFYWFLGVFLVAGLFLIPVAVRAEVPQEEMEKLKDYGTALKDTITETKDYLKDVSDKWTWVKDKYGGNPKIVGYIDKLNDSGLTKHLNNSIAVLGQYEAGIKKITNIKSDIDAINGFYDRYKPDKNNPLRSLQQMSNILEDLNSAIEKLDPSGGVLTKPFREIIAFYQQAASGFSNALGRLNKKIKERGGGGIGLGFTATTDKEKKFIKKFADQTVFPWPWIKYIRPGSSKAEAEFWDNKQDRAFVWWKSHWTEIKPGVAGLKKAYHGMRIAHGTRPTIANLISRCNTNWEKVLEAEKKGKKYFRLLYSNPSCASNILKHRKINIQSYPEKIFVAQYTFLEKARKKIDGAVKQLKNSILVQARVTEGKKGLANILVTAESKAGRVQATSDAGGWFTLLFDSQPIISDRHNARVIINADEYEAYTKDWPLHRQCKTWYNISLSGKEELIKVPDLMGHTKAWALEKLMDLQLSAAPMDGGVPPTQNHSGLITWQKPGKGALLAKGGKVSFKAYWEIVDELPSPKEDDPPPEPPPTDPTTDTSSTQEEESGTQDPPQGNVSGGLIIAGPAQTSVDQGLSYTACDGTGKPYDSGGDFSWNTTREDLFNIGKSGNPVSAVGFKPGTNTIILHYDGMTAYLDVKVKEKKKKNLFSSSGGEKTEKENSLFSSAGGEKTQPTSEDTEENRIKNQCGIALHNISIALNSGDTGAAQYFTNQAAALGCDVAPGVMAQVEALEQQEKEQREQQLAQSEDEQKQLDQTCNELRLGIVSALNQKNVDAAHTLTGQAVAMGCDVNVSKVFELTAQIDADKRQQQYQQQQQQNDQRQAQNNQQTMEAFQGMMNLFTQAMNNPPGKSNRKPNRPSLPQNNPPSFPNRTYAGMDPNVMSSVPGAGNLNSSANTNSSNTDKNNMCNTQGVKVKGIWDTKGKWHSCLKGVYLTVGNTKSADCRVSNRPPKWQLSACRPTRGRCTLNLVALKSEETKLGYIKKGDSVCMYPY